MMPCVNQASAKVASTNPDLDTPLLAFLLYQHLDINNILKLKILNFQE